jgi:hypothetical protein
MLGLIAIFSTILAVIAGLAGICLGVASLLFLVVGGGVVWIGSAIIGSTIGPVVAAAGGWCTVFSAGGFTLVEFVILVVVCSIEAWGIIGWCVPLAGLLIGLGGTCLGGLTILCCGIGGLCPIAIACSVEGFCLGFAGATVCNFCCPFTIPITFCSVFGTLLCNFGAVVCTPLFCFSWSCLACGMPAIFYEIACMICPPMWCCGLAEGACLALPIKIGCLGLGTVATICSMASSCVFYTCLGAMGILGFVCTTFCASLGVMAGGMCLGVSFLTAGTCIGVTFTTIATALSLCCCTFVSGGLTCTGATGLSCCLPSSLCAFMGITATGTTLTLGGAFTSYFLQYCQPYLAPYIDFCMPTCVTLYSTCCEVIGIPLGLLGSIVSCVPVIGTILAGLGLCAV